MATGIRRKTSKRGLSQRTRTRRLGNTRSNRRIREKLKLSFVFTALDAKELEVVVDAMDEKKCKASDVVIKQGDEGDNLYVVDAGTLTCTRQFVILFLTPGQG